MIADLQASLWLALLYLVFSLSCVAWFHILCGVLVAGNKNKISKVKCNG